MFFRPENEIANSIIFVLGVYLIFYFITTLFLIYGILFIKEHAASTRRLTPFMRDSLFKEHHYHFIPIVIEPLF